MPKYSTLLAILVAASIASACSDPPMEEPEKRFPDPINVYADNDVGEEASAPASTPSPSSAVVGPQAQFECVAGAPDATASMTNDAADRADDDGRPMTVRVYDPAGAQVFGFPVTVFETFTRADGRSGIAAYVSPSLTTVLPAVLNRFPGSSSDDGTRVTGPGMAGTITLQEASFEDDTMTRIQCASAE